MRPALLNAYAEMLPRLQAEEALLARPVIASSTGQMKRGDAATFVRELKKLAKHHAGEQVRTVGDLVRAGIPVVRSRKGVKADG